MVSVLQIRIVMIIVFGIAQVLTGARTFMRATRKKFWFDDASALLALLCSVAALISFSINASGKGLSEQSRIATSWTMNSMVTSVIWLVRLSLMCSLIRVTPSSLRKISCGFGALFILMWITLVVVAVKLCSPNPEWWQVNHRCQAPVTLFTTLSFEFFSGIILTVMPIVVYTKLRKMSLVHKGLIVLNGAIGFLLLGGSIARAVYFLTKSDYNVQQLMVIVQVGSGLLLINIPAFAALVYSVKEEDLVSEQPKTRALKSLISNPKPLSARSSFASPDEKLCPALSYHSFFPTPQDAEQRKQTALMLGLTVDSWPMDNGKSSFTTFNSMYSTDSIAQQFQPAVARTANLNSAVNSPDDGSTAEARIVEGRLQQPTPVMHPSTGERVVSRLFRWSLSSGQVGYEYEGQDEDTDDRVGHNLYSSPTPSSVLDAGIIIINPVTALRRRSSTVFYSLRDQSFDD
ncbi:hypothetical protein L218DRAFT_1000157 [Marasmius fiardii PR-910]|nr:hypothetical protein L218DRAFT_1000157 [Marasmius fiardii PR-910]